MIASGANLGQLVVSQLWQVTLLAVVIGIVVRLFARQKPHLAYLLWLLVLLKCVTPPLASSPTGVFSWLETFAAQPAEPAASTDRHLANSAVYPSPLVAEVSASTSQHVEAASAAPREQPTAASSNLTDVWAIVARPLPLLTALWLVGLFAWLALCVRRWRHCVGVLQRTQLPVDPGLAQQFTALQTRLGLRRAVRLMVTSSRLGPIVMGVWRPTVVLPAALLRDRGYEHLQPILAHELLHVRRGDLLWGWLQLVAQGVWWFHPLLWWVNRQTAREMERCCDEEVVAETGCSPADYARSLLAVLERKHQLAAVPAFPGVRSVEVTSQRLERIMKLGHGCHKRTPRWCWGAALLLAIITLPGAAYVLEAQEAPQPQEALSVKVYDVAEHLKVLHEQEKQSDADARQLLVDLVRMTDGDAWTDRLERRGDQTIAASPRAAEDLAKRAAKGSWEWAGDKLIVRQTEAGHRHVVEQLALVREYGDASLLMEFRILKTPLKLAEELKFDWKLLLDAELAAEPAAEAQPTAGPTVVRATVSRHFPCHHATIDDAQVKKLLQRTLAGKAAEVLSAPKLTTINGQSATISMQMQRPFVVAIKEIDAKEHIHEPVIRVVKTGSEIKVRGKLTAHDRVQLSLGIISTDVSKVEVARIAKDVNIQVPELATTKIASTFELPLERTLIITGLPAAQDGKSQPLTVLVRVSRAKRTSDKAVAPPEETGALPPSPDELQAADAMVEKVYSISDLIQLPYESPTVDLDLTQPKIKAEVSKVRQLTYEDVAELITETIVPNTWNRGRGTGSLTLSENAGNLIIRQTKETHEQVRELLAQVRRLHDSQFLVGLDRVEFSPQDWERLAKVEHGPAAQACLESATVPVHVDAKTLALLRKQSTRYYSLSSLMLFNGQQLALRGPFPPYQSADEILRWRFIVGFPVDAQGKPMPVGERTYSARGWVLQGESNEFSRESLGKRLELQHDEAIIMETRLKRPGDITSQHEDKRQFLVLTNRVMFREAKSAELNLAAPQASLSR